jgi:hypothetical protein
MDGDHPCRLGTRYEHTMASVIPAYRNAFRPMRSSAQISPSTNTPAPNAATFCAAYVVSSALIAAPSAVTTKIINPNAVGLPE